MRRALTTAGRQLSGCRALPCGTARLAAAVLPPAMATLLRGESGHCGGHCGGHGGGGRWQGALRPGAMIETAGGSERSLRHLAAAARVAGAAGAGTGEALGAMGPSPSVGWSSPGFAAALGDAAHGRSYSSAPRPSLRKRDDAAAAAEGDAAAASIARGEEKEEEGEETKKAEEEMEQVFGAAPEAEHTWVDRVLPSSMVPYAKLVAPDR